MNNLDKKIKLLLLQKLTIPETYASTVISTLDSLPQREVVREKTRNKLKFSLVASCCSLFLIVGLVFANDISSVFKHFFNANAGMDTAIQNGYISSPSKQSIESNNTKVSIENLLMDDFNLSFSFMIAFEENLSVENINKVHFPSMLITDENKNILFCEDRSIFENYCETNHLDYNYEENNENYLSCGTNYYIKSKILEDNKIELIYNLYTNKFPKSKQLFIDISKIAISQDEKFTDVMGNWHINLDIPEKFYNRTVSTYTVTNCSDPTLTITDSYLYPTGMRFGFKTQVQPIYEDTDSEEVKKEKQQKMSQWHTNLIKSYSNFITNEYLEDTDGNKYYPVKSSTEDARTVYPINGDFVHWQTFSLTQYDNKDKIKIYFDMNLPYETRHITITLERNS